MLVNKAFFETLRGSKNSNGRAEPFACGPLAVTSEAGLERDKSDVQ